MIRKIFIITLFLYSCKSTPHLKGKYIEQYIDNMYYIHTFTKNYVFVYSHYGFFSKNTKDTTNKYTILNIEKQNNNYKYLISNGQDSLMLNIKKIRHGIIIDNDTLTKYNIFYKLGLYKRRISYPDF